MWTPGFDNQVYSTLMKPHCYTLRVTHKSLLSAPTLTDFSSLIASMLIDFSSLNAPFDWCNPLPSRFFTYQLGDTLSNS
jgi:hypothetical protein